MIKKLFFSICFLLVAFSACRTLSDGEVIEVTCKAVDMQGNPLKGITLSLVSSDSHNLKSNRTFSNEIIEKQKVTDSKGELTFTYEYNRLLFRFIRGEIQGKLVPIELFDAPSTGTLFGKVNQIDPVFHYDSLVPIRIRIVSNLLRMKNVIVEGSMGFSTGINNPDILRQNFSISSNNLDTIFKTNVFSQPSLSINCSIEAQDSFRGKYKEVPQGGKRDSTFTFSF
jgi:hypothetical protein